MSYRDLIDLDRLEVKPPLGDKVPTKQDFEYLFNEVGLIGREIFEFYNMDSCLFYKLKKEYNIISDKNKQKEAMKRRSLEKYGVEHPAQSKEVREKYRQTCLQIYGTDNIFSSEIGKKKVKQGNLKKYGVEHNHQNKEVVDKMKKTCLEKYGCKCSLNNPNVRVRAQKTWMKNLGVDNPAKSEKIIQKMKQTNLEKYGNEIYAKTKKFKKLMQDNYVIYEKQKYETKKHNNSFHISNKEDELYNLLKEKFDNIQRQYKSEKYPFACDFYIPNLDLYIEYNGSWTHGGFPYTKTDKRCQEQLILWTQKAKTSNYYKNAINTWTNLDVHKREIAKENNLNYLEFFTYKEFFSWFKSLN